MQTNHTPDYVTKNGAQIAAIKAMLDALTSGFVPTAVLAAQNSSPEGLTVTDSSATAIALAWRAVPGATSYQVERALIGGAFAPAGNVVGPSFGDPGLRPKTSYRYRVITIGSAGASLPSAEISAASR